MKRLAITIGYLSVLWLLTSCAHHNSCSSRDRVAMEQGGFSSEEINNACTSYKVSEDIVNAATQVAQTELTKKYQNGNQTAASLNPYQQNYSGSGSAATCVTQYGQCPLMQPGTNGAPCVCYSIFGQMPGVTHGNQSPNYVSVKVFYGTDRQALVTQHRVTGYGAERGTLAVGVSEVSIPLDHHVGSLESPSVLRLEFRPDPAKHIAVLSVSPLSLGEFKIALNGTLSQSARRSGFIFIHGYNMSFDDALRRTAQIAYDLNFEGTPILYS